MTALLEANNIGVSYGNVEAVRGISLSVDAGRIVTVIGPNGAGKTSLMRALMGAHACSGGVFFEGRDIRRLLLEDRVQAGILLVPEDRALFGELSVEENLLLGGFALRNRGARELARDRDEIYGLFPRLSERMRQKASTLSGGERQMLALGRALMGRPKLLMLDEPSLGLAPRIVRDMFQIIIRLRERGVSLLVVEQNARAALQAADYGYVVEQGSVVLEGPAKGLLSNERITASYLGHLQA